MKVYRVQEVCQLPDVIGKCMAVCLEKLRLPMRDPCLSTQVSVTGYDKKKFPYGIVFP
jgi:hypothetical protein